MAGHGLPIFGADRIRQALLDTGPSVLESIEAQTLALMNTGRAGSTGCSTRSEVPATSPTCRTCGRVYDHPQFLVRNVWRRYGGWYDGEPDNLLPAPRRAGASDGWGSRRSGAGAGAGPRRWPTNG